MRAPILYYLHPEVSMFKGNGEPQIGNYLDMPDNSAAGDVSPISHPPSQTPRSTLHFDVTLGRRQPQVFAI
jgi:hypothetical protein